MDLYEINSEGALYVESVSSLPVWQSSDESRLLYDENTEILYFADSSRWIGAGAFESGIIMVFGNSTAPVGWTRKTDWQNNAMFCFAATGAPANGGSVNPQSAHTHAGPSHTHTMQNHYHTTAGHKLTIAEMPSHHHSYYGLIAAVGQFTSSWGTNARTRDTTDTGGDQPHNHGNTGGPSNNTTSSNSGTTGANSIPHFQELIAAEKD